MSAWARKARPTAGSTAYPPATHHSSHRGEKSAATSVTEAGSHAPYGASMRCISSFPPGQSGFPSPSSRPPPPRAQPTAVAGHDPRARVEGGFQFVAQARREVVGRLVQQEQFRGTGDQQGQGEPSPLADGQLRDRPVEVGCGQQAELRQRYGFGPFGAEGFGVDGPRGALRAPEPVSWASSPTRRPGRCRSSPPWSRRPARTARSVDLPVPSPPETRSRSPAATSSRGRESRPGTRRSRTATSGRPPGPVARWRPVRRRRLTPRGRPSP